MDSYKGHSSTITIIMFIIIIAINQTLFLIYTRVTNSQYLLEYLDATKYLEYLDKTKANKCYLEYCYKMRLVNIC